MKQRNREEFINFLIKITMITLFTMGALVFSYPFISDSINNFYDQKMMKSQLTNSNETTRLEREARIEELARLNAEMAEKGSGKNIPGIGLVEDPFADNITKNENPGEEYFQEHLLGAIYIPTIKVSLPVFDETNDILLEKGSTLLQGTSYPIGGDTTHSVITSHSGLPEKRLFTDLEKLKEGDKFFIEIGDEILAYEIFEFTIVLPHEIDTLAIQEGEDLVTLLTCTPYMINTHRLLVTGRRVDFQVESVLDEIESVKNYHTTRVYWNIGALIGFLILSLIWAVRKYHYYAQSKKLFPLAFTVKGSSNEQYQLYTLLGVAIPDMVATSDHEDLVDFGEVNGKTYWIGFANDKKSRIKIKAKIKKKRFTVGIKTGLLKREKCGSND